MWRISELSSGAPLHAEKHIGLVALPTHCASRQTSRPTCRVIPNHLNASATTATSDVPCPCCNSHTTRLDDNWQPRFASPYARSLSLDRKVRIKVGGSQRPTERLFRGMLKPPPTPGWAGVAPAVHLEKQAIMMSTQRMAGAAPPQGRSPPTLSVPCQCSMACLCFLVFRCFVLWCVV